MVGISCGHNFISYNKFLIYSISFPITAKTINLDSIVKCEIHFGFLEAHETTRSTTEGKYLTRRCLVITGTSDPTSVTI